MTWQYRMVESLLRQRAAGIVDFDRAWRAAERIHGRPRDYYRRPDSDDPDWLPFSTWFREACRREWEGRARTDYVGLRELLEDSGLVARRRVDARDARTRLLA